MLPGFVLLHLAILKFPKFPMLQLLGSFQWGDTHAESSCRRCACVRGFGFPVEPCMHMYTCAHSTASAQKYSTHIQRRQAGYLLLHTHICIICTYGCGIDFSGPHIPRAHISIKHEKSGSSLKAGVPKSARISNLLLYVPEDGGLGEKGCSRCWCSERRSRGHPAGGRE